MERGRVEAETIYIMSFEFKRPSLRISELIGFYLALFLLYTQIPEPLRALKHVLSGFLLATLVLIFGVGLLSIKRR